MGGVLEGVRVLSWTTWVAGSWTSTMLGDMGAEVIKIEQPVHGDTIRGLLFIDRLSFEMPGKKSAVFEVVNRNTKSITLDVTKEEGRQVLFRLVEKSDVLVTNLFRTAEKVGLDYEAFSRVNPRLVYAKITGYGSKGPFKDKAGYDPQAQALSGLMDRCSGAEGAPELLEHAVLDHATAMMGGYAILAALVGRNRSGTGQEVEVSLLGTGVSLLSTNLAPALLMGKDFTKHDRRRTANPMRNYYRCADGKWMLGAHTPPDRYWPTFCKAMNIPHLQHDPRFATREARDENSQELIALLDQVFAAKTSKEWLSVFAGYPDMSWVPVHRCTDLPGEPQVMENNYIVKYNHPEFGEVLFPGFPIHFSKTPCQIFSPAPELGQHTEEVLQEVGGYTWDEIGHLKEVGAI